MELAKHLGKDTISLAYLELESRYKSGWDKYTLQGVNAIEVWLNPCVNKLKIRGSIPYFMQGHNFTSSPDLLEQAFLFIQDQLSTYLFDAEVKKLEFGQIIEVSQKPEVIFSHHHNYKRSPLTRYKHGLVHVDNGFKLKLYNAKQNLVLKTSKDLRHGLIKSHVFNPKSEYIKVESHITNLPKSLGINDINTTDLLDKDFWDYCNEDLARKYSYITKTGNHRLPMKKKDINSSTMPLLVLADKGKQYGFNPETELKQLLQSFPDELLNIHDKKARLRQLKQNLNKIMSSELSNYDLTTAIKEMRQSGTKGAI